MALPSSGSLSIGQIKTELGSNNNSLEGLSIEAKFPAPYRISNFYGYTSGGGGGGGGTTPSTMYWKGDGVNDTLRFQGINFGYSTSEPLTWSAWYRIDSSGGAVEQLGSISKSSPNGSNMVFLQFDGRNNRIYHRYRFNGSFAQRQYPLHSNLSQTGVSSAGWKSSNRGNVNAAGFAHIVFTWNPSDTSYNALQVYWNGNLLTSSVNNQNGSRAHWTGGSLAVADLVSSQPNNANVFQGAVDNVAIWKRVLSQAEITAMYNGGVPVQFDDANVNANILGEYRFEGATNDATGNLPDLNMINGGQILPY